MSAENTPSSEQPLVPPQIEQMRSDSINEPQETSMQRMWRESGLPGQPTEMTPLQQAQHDASQQRFIAFNESLAETRRKSFTGRLDSYLQDNMGALIGDAVKLEQTTPDAKKAIEHDAKVFETLVGHSATTEDQHDARYALSIVREELRFAKGDHKRARLEVYKLLHPDIADERDAKAAAWVDKLWDKESGQFKI